VQSLLEEFTADVFAHSIGVEELLQVEDA